MKLSICRRNYEDKKWFAWYPVYWGYEGGKWIWLEFVYRKWSAWDKGWVITSKEQYDKAELAREQYRRDKQKVLDEWDASPQKAREIVYSIDSGMGRGRGFCGGRNR